MTLVGGRVVRRQLTLLVAALAARSPVKVESAVVLIRSQWPDAKKFLLDHEYGFLRDGMKLSCRVALESECSSHRVI